MGIHHTSMQTMTRFFQTITLLLVTHGVLTNSQNSPVIRVEVEIDSNTLNTIELASEFSIDVVNYLNGMFSSIGVQIILHTVRQRNLATPVDTDAAIALAEALLHRRYEHTEAAGFHDVSDYLITLTETNFKNSIVGKSILQGICTSAHSGTIVSLGEFMKPVAENQPTPEYAFVTLRNNFTRVSIDIPTLCFTIAHEIGHGLGLNDESSNHQNIMSAILHKVSTPLGPNWSNASRTNLIDNRLPRYECLTHGRRPLKTRYASCGNGVLDAGEECDCGHPLGVACLTANHCCNPHTCRLHPYAQCSPDSIDDVCCDRLTCQFKPNGTECRPHADPYCDQAEYCTGTSSRCPPDVVVASLQPCAWTPAQRPAAYCVRGQCNTRTKQCIKLWGLQARPACAACYRNNSCGRFWEQELRDIQRVLSDSKSADLVWQQITHHVPCQEEHQLCGSLQCTLPANSLRILQAGTGTSNVRSRYTRCNRAKIQHCLGASFELGPQHPDPAMVADGTACGPNRACFNNRCLTITLLTTPSPPLPSEQPEQPLTAKLYSEKLLSAFTNKPEPLTDSANTYQNLPFTINALYIVVYCICILYRYV